MLRDHRPAYMSRAARRLEQAYARHFLHPHFAAVGEGCEFQGPRHIGVFGGPVRLGRHVCVAASRTGPVSFAVWSGPEGPGQIDVGDYAMINPGARIASVCGVSLGKNALLAPNVYITDCDWHDPHDRVYSLGAMGKVSLGDNVWLGDGAVVCKGVRIGENTVVGARSVVTHDLPANCVAAGNPAKVIRELDPNQPFVSREHALRDPAAFRAEAARQEHAFLAGNSLGGYLRYLLVPRRGD